MASSSSMERSTTMTAIFIILCEIIGVIVLLSPEQAKETVEKEVAKVEAHFGSDASDWILKTSGDWYNALFIESGFRDEAYRVLQPKISEDEIGQGTNRLQRISYQWIHTRVEMGLALSYLLITRFCSLLLWLPLGFCLVVPAFMDGWYGRRIKQTNYAYISPFFQRISFSLAEALFFGTIIIFVLPFAVSPGCLPAVFFLAALAIDNAIRNINKRI